MIKVLFLVEHIPLNSTVTKKTGNKRYTLRDKLRVFNEDYIQQELKAIDGTRFLVGDTGDANVVGSNTELVWIVDEEQFLQYLTDLLEGPSQ
jgi:hypothetical protein